MSIITNQKQSFQRLTETNYAGGDAGLKRSLTKIAALTPTQGFWCFTKGSSITMPKVTIEKINFGGSLASNYKRYRSASAHKHRDGQTEHYIQDNSLITAAMLADGANPSTSYVLHWEDGVSRYESFGSFISEYTLNLSSTKLPTQSCVWKCHNTKVGISTGTDVLARTDVPLIATAFAMRSDCSLSIAGTNTLFESLKCVLSNIVFEKEIENGMEHVITSKEIKLSFTSIETDTTLYNKDIASTIGDQAIVIATGKFTLTISHCDVVPIVDSEAVMENGHRICSYDIFPTIATEVTLS